MIDNHFRYDVGLSFAGEQREYVNDVASELTSRGIRVFYDDFERGELWGKDLYDYLSEVYQHMCNYCVIFASKEYASKVWTNRERQSAQARAIDENREYILPARFDSTPIPGLLPTIHYIDLTQVSTDELCDLIEAKLGMDTKSNYLPPNLDRLYSGLHITDNEDWQDGVDADAWAFLQVLQRMSEDERQAVFALLSFGCPTELPENIHIDADLLRRITDMSVPKLQRHLGDVRSLGFRCRLRERSHRHSESSGELLGDVEVFELRWENPSVGRTGEIPALLVAAEMIHVATANLCRACGYEALERLDFSQLASATATDESHEAVVEDDRVETNEGREGPASAL